MVRSTLLVREHKGGQAGSNDIQHHVQRMTRRANNLRVSTIAKKRAVTSGELIEGEIE
jgi:hypothetical protein